MLVLSALFLFVQFSGKSPVFWTEFNRDSMARTISLQSVLALGELLVILTGGIDLSLGSLVAFSGMLLSILMTRMAESGMDLGAAAGAAIPITLLVSLFLGLLHATLIHKLRLPPFVVTLASMSILRGGALLVNNALPLPIGDFALVRQLGNGKVYFTGTGVGLPISTLILTVLAVVLGFMLTRSSIGRHLYSVGSNEEASRLSGVGVFRVRLVAYGTCSLLGGLAGVLYAGYSGQGDPAAGPMFELNAISAAVIGGAVLTGGRGSVVGTLLGVALLECILNVINLTLSNPTLWRGVVVGCVLLAAVVLNQIRIHLAQAAWRRTGPAGERAGP